MGFLTMGVIVFFLLFMLILINNAIVEEQAKKRKKKPTPPGQRGYRMYTCPSCGSHTGCMCSMIDQGGPF